MVGHAYMTDTAISRGELSEVIARLSVCEAGGSGSEGLNKRPPPSPADL